jgi:hypothetical protein
MSRLVGVVALVIAFGWSGFLLWRFASPSTTQGGLPLRPKPIAGIEAVQRDLCSLAQAELQYQHATGQFAALQDLRKGSLPDSRWPYTYVLYLPPNEERFLIVAVSVTPIDTQPRVFQIDDQLQVQTRTHPAQVYPCKTLPLKESKREPK